MGADGYARVTLQAPRDGSVKLSLGSIFSVLAGDGESLTLDRWLPAGDHYLVAAVDDPGEDAYVLSIERLNPYDLPADLEPVNNVQSGAQSFPAGLTVSGETGDRDDLADWYTLAPVEASTATFTTEGDRVEVKLYVGQEEIALTQNRDAGTFAGSVPPQQALDLRVRANGVYSVALAWDPAVAAVETSDALPVTLALDPLPEPVAAFWQESQEQTLAVRLANQSDSEQSLTLDAYSSHYAWTPLLAETTLTLGPGESLDVLLTVNIRADVADQRPVVLMTYPTSLQIIEQPVDGTYSTILAEYGQYRRDPSTNLARHAGGQPIERADGNDNREGAQPLESGQVVRGTAAVGVDEDWHRIRRPCGRGASDGYVRRAADGRCEL